MHKETEIANETETGITEWFLVSKDSQNSGSLFGSPSIIFTVQGGGGPVFPETDVWSSGSWFSYLQVHTYFGPMNIQLLAQNAHDVLSNFSATGNLFADVGFGALESWS